MSQSLRQSELFAGRDWRVLYRAFTQINFNASDPPSINRALREYIQVNYAEDFSDWIESSEFVAIIDLLSWLAGTLAFRTDINARENFLESAEARESILRLARFLSYNPRRNQPARGLLKLQEIQTNDDVFDAFGNNLSNRLITWNNPDDPDWFERIVLILNAAFISTNPFGIPLKHASVSGVKSQLYRVNNRFGDLSLSFNKTVSGEQMRFEVTNNDFDEGQGFFERAPNLADAFHMIYRSDGNGNGSKNTGFFVGFKQGELRRQSFDVQQPIENLLLDISEDNINQSDVWVQTVTDGGDVIDFWEKVPAIFSDNITFNNIQADVRNIFSVITRDNDRISVRFADGRFGAAPVGNLRVWYRISNGFQYQIRPKEMERVSIDVPYFNRRGVRKVLKLTFSLEESVSNSTPRETEEQIRRRAPQVYATQNRMVSGEDYNTFPLQSNLATKIKAVNRIYSGHSRFIDLNDPTGNYQDTNVFSDDGLFYKENNPSYAEVPVTDNRPAEELIGRYIQPMLKSNDLFNYVHDYMIRAQRGGFVTIPENMVWTQVTDSRFTSTGWFNQANAYVLPGGTLLFSKSGHEKWVNILDLHEPPTAAPPPGVAGPVTLAEPVEADSKVLALIPRFATSLPDYVVAQIKSKIEDSLSFTLWYDYNPDTYLAHWTVRSPETLDSGNQTAGTAIKLMSVEYLNGSVWRINCHGMRYVFESMKNVHFYFDGQKAVDTENRLQQQDIVRVLSVNEDLNQGFSLERDYDLAIDRMIVYSDGYADPRRIVVRFRDTDEDGYPDDPDTYFRIASDRPADTHLFWKRDEDGTYSLFYDMHVYEREIDRRNDNAVVAGTVAFQITGEKPRSFWLKTENGWVSQSRNYRAARGRGPNVAARYVMSGGALVPKVTPNLIKFQWKHYAPSDRRIDPAKTNIIDTFVLTSEYDFITRQWIAAGADTEELPPPPSELELRMTFGEFEQYKMFSDDIVWRPAKYKFLFGNGADQNLRAQFKVVKLPNAAMSDGEIKSRVIRAVNSYFNADFWDFGETFFYTELAAYIHQQLASSIASVVIVPLSDRGTFGDGFEVKCRSDELFISTAQVTDVTIIDSNTHTNLRIN